MEETERPVWACPFFKYQPQEFPDCRRCSMVRLSDIAQHIYRRHLVPIHCPKCGDIFETESERLAHLTGEPCQVTDFRVIGATSDQMESWRASLRVDPEHMPGNCRDERRWYGRYTSLFGQEANLPDSPYIAAQDQVYLERVPPEKSIFNRDIMDITHLKDFFKGAPTIYRELTQFAMDNDEAGTFSPASAQYPDSGYGTASRCSAPYLEKRAEIAEVLSSNTQEIEQQDDDIETVYSDATSLSDPIYGKYVVALAENISNSLGSLALDPQLVARLSAALPRLLRALALSIGYQAPSQIHRDVMVFIYKYRNDIAGLFQEYNTHDTHQEPELESERVFRRDVLDWIAMTAESRSSSPPPRPYDVDLRLEDDIDVFADEPDEELVIPALEEYSKFISGLPGYSWLRDQLRREALMVSPGRDVLDEVRNRILDTIPTPRRISRKASPQACTVVYVVDWNPIAFLYDQDYEQSESDNSAIANAVTLTGLCDDAHALSCREYLNQTWPRTGENTLRLIQSLLANGQSANRVCKSRPLSWLTLSASFESNHLLVKATGVPDFVAEIGEQLAWLGAALRPGPSNMEHAIYCVPKIGIQPSPSSVALNQSTKHDSDCIVHFNIDFGFEDCEPSSIGESEQSGRCWHGFFRRPVIVRGFPILSRPKRSTGLEMPLNMMTALADTKCIQKFGGKLFTKGFSTMLVPTEVCDGLLLWHLLHTKDANTRISYLDCHFEHAKVELAELHTYRHVVGWCSEVISHVGSASAEYDIGRSHLPEASSESSLEKVEIQTGYIVNATAVFSLGNREKPVHISRHGYLTKLQWISSKHVIFWDEGDKRGWLVNGADALLHLLRASLHHSKREFGSAFLLDPTTLVTPPTTTHQDPSQDKKALQFLTDPRIRLLRLSVEAISTYDQEIHDDDPKTSKSSPRTVPIKETRYSSLQDRIEHIYSTLEKLIDHKADLERKNGFQIKKRLRRHLDGWDFRDVATGSDPFFARVSTLQTMGKGWVDFARGIHAVTLFGRGFGELFQPTAARSSPSSCSLWSVLPRNRFYLAARVADLHQIMSEEGDAKCHPRKLCHNVVWHMRRTTFAACPCTAANQGAKQKHHDPVQALFPARFATCLRKKEGKATLLEENGAGAVVFGHNMSLHWHWRDEGDPIKGDPPLEENESEVASSTRPEEQNATVALSGTEPQLRPPPDNMSSSSQSTVTVTTTSSDRSSSSPAVSYGRTPYSRTSSATSDIMTPLSQEQADESGMETFLGIRPGKRRLQETLLSVSKRLKF